ncbi:hypothetical protein [Candidatus Venteria ishoeyi]|uniref:Uncharacterized protein n=1 Tax=Candidatus Venteria ishoeyi TaxID=1899563 RepID=A0A1H6F5H7_9GAMM|nr:hypothetical protein [Candidatus Venteria ishoeyi]SEH04813.1 Uncharacterised protein [Candidatus Venteria ishoeyi]
MATFGCDGCNQIYQGEPIVINAKQWNENICDGPFQTEFEDCIKFNCQYNIEGMCVEFHFCKFCSIDKKTLNELFANFNH